MKTYEVTVWTENRFAAFPRSRFQITAATKLEAVKMAHERLNAKDYDRVNGPMVTYKELKA